MKTHLLLLISSALFLFSSCKSDLKNVPQDGFTKELATLSSKPLTIFASTRSGSSTLNADVINEMIEYTTDISEKYDLTAIVQASGYYSIRDQSLAGMDFYQTMQYFKANSTPEFYALISDIIVDEKIVDNNSIINNNKLLPNEQIALIMINNIIKSNPVDIQTRGVDCRGAYNNSMGTCKKWLYGTLAGSLALACVSFGTLSAVCAAAATVDYERCSGAAMDTYMNCMER